jgi:hypothetical protein
MVSGRGSQVLIGLLVALVAGMVGLVVMLIYNASGPVAYTYGTVVSARYVEGWSTTTQIPMGEHMTVPMTTNYPGAWTLEVDSPVLGRTEVTCPEDLPPGQEVYLRYVIGRLSHKPELVEMRLHPATVKVHE